MSKGIKQDKRLVFVPLLVDRTLNKTVQVSRMNGVISNFKLNSSGLLNETFYEKRNHETITVNMPLGINISQYMSSVTWEEVLGGSCFVLNNKVAPMGTVLNFLNKNLSKFLIKSLKQSNEEILSPQTKTMIKLVMNPLKSYFNP